MKKILEYIVEIFGVIFWGVVLVGVVFYMLLRGLVELLWTGNKK